jgi:hypothetical protein
MSSHIENRYLSIHATETAHLDNGNTSAKTAMLTLGEEEGRAVYEWLRALYEVRV